MFWILQILNYLVFPSCDFNCQKLKEIEDVKPHEKFLRFNQVETNGKQVVDDEGDIPLQTFLSILEQTDFDE
jgi:hypothetical protein